MKSGRILVFADDTHLRGVISAALGPLCQEALWFSNLRAWLSAAESASGGVMLLSHRNCPVGLAAEVRDRRAAIPLIFVTDSGSESLAIVALRCGALDYFVLSGTFLEFRASLEQLLEEQKKPSVAAADSPEQLVGASSHMLQVHEDIRNIAQSDSNVLITGETGTGKELVASMIHYNSARQARPLTCINCAAIPDGLFESELFGYERGAFTGAITSYEGKLKASNGGSVFFDEVGDLSLFAQAKLLRLLDTKEVQRLGDVRSFRVDVRIIAATHRDLDAMVREERFRSDLYFRLNVARVRLPALREHKIDIVAIAEHTLRLLNRRLGAQIEGFEQKALECVLRYSWPGNVRELRNVVEGILIRRRSGWITVSDLPLAMRQPTQAGPALPDDELARMLAALTATEWNKSKAAEKLHWSRMTLYRKIAKYNVQPHLRAGAAIGAHSK